MIISDHKRALFTLICTTATLVLVLVHRADVATAQGCSCDSFPMTLRTFKHRTRICIYLSHIQKDYIINMDYVRLSTNLYIHHVRLSINLYVHYVRLSTSYMEIVKLKTLQLY